MTISKLLNALTGLMLLLLATACDSAPESEITKPIDSLHTLVLIHWAGTERIGTDTNSATVREIAALPESIRLKEQTLEKLSRASWTLAGISVDTNASVVLKSVLAEALRHECRFKMAAPNDQTTSFALAVRLDQETSSAWETNLASVAKSIRGTAPLPLPDNRPGWILQSTGNRSESQSTNATRLDIRLGSMAFTRLDGWTVVGMARDLATFDTTARTMLAENIHTNSSSDLWLDAMIDLPSLTRKYSISTNLFFPPPLVRLSLTGKEQKVRTDITFDFPQPLNLNLKPWLVPTHLIEKPSASFSAVRGLDGLLAGSKWWKDLSLTPSPDQMFVWALEGEPRFTFFAAQVADAQRFVKQVEEQVLPSGQAWHYNDGLAGFKKSVEHDGVEWQGLPYLWPFLRSVVTNNQSQILGGTFVYTPVIEPLSIHFYEDALNPKNLVYYGWEKTGRRLEHWLFIGQFIRFVSGMAQLPSESAGVLWLKSLQLKLGDSLTRLYLTRADECCLTRSSSLGLTAIEMHLLVDWLESPDFPVGFQSEQPGAIP